jgi:hypothetical protein
MDGESPGASEFPHAADHDENPRPSQAWKAHPWVVGAIVQVWATLRQSDFTCRRRSGIRAQEQRHRRANELAFQTARSSAACQWGPLVCLLLLRVSSGRASVQRCC